MRRVMTAVVVLSSLFLLNACDDDEDEGEDEDELSGWAGETEHLIAEGEMAGRTLVLDVEGGDAADKDVLFCERNYVDGNLEKVDIRYSFTYEGMPAELEVEFGGFDYSVMVNEPVPVGTADTPTLDAMDVTTKITLDDGTEFADEAKSGTFDLKPLTGTEGDDGIIPSGEGKFGGYLDAELESGSKLRLSVTAGCGDNVVE